jgi:LCP family protein required for cell wall assembly
MPGLMTRECRARWALATVSWRTVGTGDAEQRESPAVVPVLVSAAVPGVETYRRHWLLGSVLFAAGVVFPLAWLIFWVLHARSWMALGLDRRFLGQLVVVLVIVVVSRVAAVAEVLLSTNARPRRGVRFGVAITVLIAVALPCFMGVDTAAEARADIGRAFQSAGNAPIYNAGVALAPAPTTAGPTTTAVATVATAPSPSTSVATTRPSVPQERIPNQTQPPAPPDAPPDSGVDPGLLTDVSTILLLGGDAGPGRSGLRTDSMILVSIHRSSGRAALISVPRNLEHLLFPPATPLARRYPQGFDDIANAVYPRVSGNQSLRDAYRIDELSPGAVAIAQGLGYSLDVTIDDYVLIDMQGFLEIIDALGGVMVDVPRAVPAPGNPPGARHQMPAVIPAGLQFMDGTTALSYVRSRKADTDYRRADRQRSVLAALARQVTLSEALSGYSTVTSVLGDRLRTSLTTDEFTNFLGLLGGETAIVESVGLVPPLVNPANPDYDALAKIVGKVQLALVTGQRSGY